ncbi:MAG: S8 family serine peptidase [Firmicutes bacterium]|uniref:Serine protease AprX n=1 Tax=Melghirimyces thermohalophilus TaxID=1236220 RepID=A0A1G6QDF0_9BACL|nr:S8 family serine peptidase [Melghirimyces thermohalophilus]MDA8351873.1 S8 family serine peptidase [Bacillota bacterium]SDC90532.1 serine protease AprX [Melghirimyces thermohalophilus]
MSQTHYQWIREYGRRMDSDLRCSLIQRLHLLRYIPCFFHRATLSLMERLSRVPVLVQVDQHAKVSASLQNTLYNNPSSVDFFNSIHMFRMHLNLNQLHKMMKHPEVKRVYLDRKVYALLDTAAPAVNAPLAWKYGNTGERTGIAIIDTGIHAHPDLMNPEPRIAAFKDFVKGKTSPYDDNGHGTHCAGDAAGNGYASDGKYKGPAPGAKLIGVKVLDKAGSGQLSDVISGIEWCIQNREKYNIRVLSLSLGSRTNSSYKDDPVAQAVEKAWDHGITVVAAAGNDGPDPGTISSPGIHPRIITVGASNDKGTPTIRDDEAASFSSRGPTPDGVTKPDLLAPGTDIVSLRVPRSYIDKMSPDSRINRHYTTLSGTSMATPIVAGMAAVLLTHQPDLTPDEVKRELVQAAQSLELPPNVQGEGLAQAADSWFKG